MLTGHRGQGFPRADWHRAAFSIRFPFISRFSHKFRRRSLGASAGDRGALTRRDSLILRKFPLRPLPHLPRDRRPSHAGLEPSVVRPRRSAPAPVEPSESRQAIPRLLAKT